MIAQINFSEIPKIENFTDRGILQFWIADDANYGMSDGELSDQKHFRVIYDPQVQTEDLITKVNFLPKDEDFPIEHPYNCDK